MKKSLTQIPGTSLLREGATDDEAAQLISWTNTGRKTHFASVVADRMKLALTMKNNAIKLIDAMRCTAQPNRNFRRDRLVPSDVNASSERIDLAKELKEAGGVCYDNMSLLKEYTREVSKLEMEIDRHHEVFLRQVVIYGTKPLKSYVDVSYPLFHKAYSDLEKIRDKYDSVRRKKNAAKIVAARQELVDQARVLASLMDELPAHQLSFAKALDSFIRAEAGFGGKMSAISFAVKQPDSKGRWGIRSESVEVE